MEEKMVNGQQPEAKEVAPPKMIEQQVFNILMNRLLFNTGFFVLASLKEKPRFDGDVSVYIVNIVVNNSVVNVNSDLIAILNANCNTVQLSNDARFPNQILVGCEIYVVPTKVAAPAAEAVAE
jgi:hypothetical protein